MDTTNDDYTSKANKARFRKLAAKSSQFLEKSTSAKKEITMYRGPIVQTTRGMLEMKLEDEMTVTFLLDRTKISNVEAEFVELAEILDGWEKHPRDRVYVWDGKTTYDCLIAAEENYWPLVECVAELINDGKLEIQMEEE